MFLVAKLHPDLPEANNKHYTGTWLSRKEKKEQIRIFYEEEREIPLCVDHLDAGKFGFIDGANVIGRVVDLFNDREGNMMVKCQLSPEHKSYLEINEGIFHRGEKWGVSVGLSQQPAPLPGGRRVKELVHVALTTQPGFQRYGVQLSDWGLNEDVVNATIAKKYYRQGREKCYATEAFETKLKGVSFFEFFPLSIECMLTHPQRVTRVP